MMMMTTTTDPRPATNAAASAPTISDDVLTALALAADPDMIADPAGVPWTAALVTADGLLPDWYMPAPVTGRRGWWPKMIAALVILAFVVINAFGLCITYGYLSPA